MTIGLKDLKIGFERYFYKWFDLLINLMYVYSNFMYTIDCFNFVLFISFNLILIFHICETLIKANLSNKILIV